MTLKKTTLALACGLALSATANADLIVNDGEGGSIPNSAKTNDVIGESSASQPAGFGANLYSDGYTNVTFEFLGKEASFDNVFKVKDSEVFRNSTAQQGDSYTTTFSDGTLDFAFVSGGGFGTVFNGSNPDEANDNQDPNFFAAEVIGDGSEGLFLALDDNGANEDDNHDDMVLKVTSSKVPEPGTLALLGLGLAGLGLSYRRSS